MRTDCLSAEDSNTHCSTTSSRGQRVDDDDFHDVSRLPDTVVVDHPSSDIIERLTEKNLKKHTEALKQLDTELTELTQVCETQVRTVSQELLSSLQEVDLRLDSLKDRMEQLEHLDHEVCGLWEQVEEEVKLKKKRIMELDHKLTESETQRTNEIRAVLRKYCHLLLPPDVYTLIHTEATVLNQSLLVNRRSAARLLLLLKEDNLQQESLLRLRWEDCLSRWRRSRVTEVIDRFTSLCSSGKDQQLTSVQQMKQTQQDLTEQRRALIYRICSLVPPTCSTALVWDWFNQLTAVNQKIDSLHADLLHQLRCCYEQTWQDQLAEVRHCQEALSALQLSEEEVNDVVSSQLLALIGRSQSQDEERLSALDVCCDSVACHALSLTRCVFVVIRGATLLWETHSSRLESREKEMQQHLDNLRHSQQQHIQRKKVRLDDLLAGLRQESSEDTLKTSLDKTVLYLQDVKHSCRQCVSDQWEVLEHLPSVFLEELLSYSSSLSSFYRLKYTYAPAEYSLLDLCDISSYVKFISSKGVTYTGPAFSCPAPDLPDDLEQKTHLSLFPVELLTHTLSRTRTLFLDHLEQHFCDVLSSSFAMVTDRKEAVSLEQELQLQQLDSQHIQTHIYQPRLAELQLHQRYVEVHCEEVLDVLTSCRTELQHLQTSISRRNLEFTVTLSNMEDGVRTASSSQRLEAVSSSLQDCVDQHVKDTQSCQTSFRQTVQIRLEGVRQRTTQLLSSFRLFSEGGDFSPHEVKVLKRRLTEETKHINVTEESICSELDRFESRSLQQVKEVSGRFEEKLSFMKSEVTFMEKIQRVINSSQVHIKAEAAFSNQQQIVISSRLEEVKKMMENTQVSPDQVCSVLSSVNEALMKRCQYLDFGLVGLLLYLVHIYSLLSTWFCLDHHLSVAPVHLDYFLFNSVHLGHNQCVVFVLWTPPPQEGLTLSARSKSRKEVRSAPPAGLLEVSRTGVDLLDDPVVDIIKSLNRFCVIQEGPAETSRPAAAQSPVHRPQLRSAESVSALRGGCRSIRADRRFQVFGPKPETEQNTHSFSSTVNSVLWKTNDVLLLAAEDFYRRECLGRFQLLPDSLDQWADSMQRRLLGYQEQARRLLSTSREDLVDQLSVLDGLLHSFPAVLISNYEQQQEAELREEVGGVRRKLEEILTASEQEKTVNLHQLRVSVGGGKLQTVISREEGRQERLHSAVCCSHLELQECVRVRGEEFVTLLASLTEKLLCQLDDLLTPAETKAASHQHSEDSTLTMETGTDPGQRSCTGNRTWSGISYLTPPTNITDDLSSSVTTATTASITATSCTLGHLTVIEQRDKAVKRFEQLFRSELLRSDDDKRNQLRKIQNWNTHWRQEIHSLKHTH
ncbi:coiled-coil domain-containing protein 180 [Seriola dumerili]|uniref:coiled-coil domain-containing protein 180 n=1 Tax=Seriola dumerili TaxID=41447 RepID=UPI000BBEDA07|nr:coiled-coil domain-containing protein 180 [Seriola dumerili]